MELVSKKEKKILANIDSEIQSFPKNVINRVLFSMLLASRILHSTSISTSG